MINSMIDSTISNDATLNSLNEPWIRWLCEALIQGADHDAICAALISQGASDPEQIITRLENHPIFKWSRDTRPPTPLDTQRAQKYRMLHHQLWSERISKLPIVENLDASSFFEHYYYNLRPVIIRGWVSNWSASQQWNPYLWRERFAGVPVEVSAGRDQLYRYDRLFDETRSTVDFGVFAQELIDLKEPSNDRYLIARNYAFDRPELAELLTEIDEQPYLDPQCRFGSLALWFGPQGTITPLHHDTCHIMFAQIYGEKQFSLIPPHAQELFDQATSMYSDLDPALDLSLHPQHPHQLNITLRAGEALFIPVGWWHAVRSLSLSISLAMTHFRRPNQFDWYRPNSKLLHHTQPNKQ